MRLFIALIFIFIVSVVNGQTDTALHRKILDYSLEELLNVKVVTAKRHEQKVEEVSANVEIIYRSDIEKFGYTSLKELLQNITGFYHIEDHYWLGSSNFGVRGFFKTGAFSNVAILVNGVNQMSDKYSDFPDVKITIPIEAIERVEVVNGPMAVAYGNGAFFGVVNIITSIDYSQKNRFTQLHVSGGGSSSYNASVQVGRKLNDISYKIIAGANKSNGPNYKYAELTTDTSYLEYIGLNSESTVKKHLDYSSIYTGIQLEYKNFDFDFSYNESNKGIFDGSPAMGNGNNLNTIAANVNLGYKKEISEEFKLQSNLSYFSHSHMLNYELFRFHYYEIDYQKTSSYFAELIIDWIPTSKFSIDAGLNRRTVLDILQISDFGYYGLDYGDGEIGLPQGENFSTHSLFTQMEYKPIKKIAFNIGMRLEHLEKYNMFMSRGVVSENPGDNRPPTAQNRYVIEEEYTPDNNGFSLMPQMAIIYEPVQTNYLKLMYGEAQKIPSFSENYRQLPGGREPLYASKIQTLELNYYTKSIKKSVLSTSVFLNYLNNLIEATNVYDPVTGEWDIYSTNSGIMQTIGWEMVFNHKPTKNIVFNLKGVYQKTSDKRKGYDNIEPGYSPQLLAYMNFLYTFNNNLSIGLNGRFIDEMETSWITETTPEEGNRLGEKTPTHIILDINIRKEGFFNKPIYVNFNVDNIFNSQYRYPTTKSNTWIDKGALGLGINFMFSTGIKF